MDTAQEKKVVDETCYHSIHVYPPVNMCAFVCLRVLEREWKATSNHSLAYCMQFQEHIMQSLLQTMFL